MTIDPTTTMPRNAKSAWSRRAAARILVVAALGILPSCSSEPAERGAGQAPAAGAASAAAAAAAAHEAGRSLYETHCGACHGPSGLGDGPLAASLPVKPANIIEHLGDHSTEELIRRVAEGMPAMPPALISSEQIAQVVDYIWSTLPDSTQSRLRAVQLLMMEEH